MSADPPEHDSVRALTRAIAAGDPAAFARLYDAWFDRLAAEARRATGRDESFCLDVVHDAMMKVIRSMPTLEHEAQLAAWLRRVVRTSAYDRLRTEARRARRERERTDAETAAPPVEPDAERLEWLRAELGALDDPTRQLLDMRHRFGWTLARIGAALGLRPGAVDRRLRTAVEGLRARAEGDEP